MLRQERSPMPSEETKNSLLDMLESREVWERFYEYKLSLVSQSAFERELRRFIDREEYVPVCRRITAGGPFPLPKRSVISKMDSAKKRIVYTYPEPENTVLKLLTWLLLRRYDGLFSDNLFSFRPGRTAKDAIRMLRQAEGMRQSHSYKADISNYFNSIPVGSILPMLREVFSDDAALCSFLERLLTEPRVLYEGRTITEEKGIMAGTPLSAFYANLYLKDLDRHFQEAGVPYARYSDDMILFAGSREETEREAAFLKSFLKEKGLTLNPDKEEFRTPEEGWIFLGFSYRDGVVDIAPASLQKIKSKMRRKTRALRRWAKRNHKDPERAASAFIRIFNRKLLGVNAGGAADPEEPGNELTWSRWFFSVINTDQSLREIDHYAQECIRCLISGTHTKARFNVRYGDIRRLGCLSLVHAYYEARSGSAAIK